MPKTVNMNELREKSDEDLAELIRTTTKKVLETRFQNYTNQLNDTSMIRKLRRDLARALTVRAERASGRSGAEAQRQGEGP